MKKSKYYYSFGYGENNQFSKFIGNGAIQALKDSGIIEDYTLGKLRLQKNMTSVKQTVVSVTYDGYTIHTSCCRVAELRALLEAMFNGQDIDDCLKAAETVIPVAIGVQGGINEYVNRKDLVTEFLEITAKSINRVDFFANFLYQARITKYGSVMYYGRDYDKWAVDNIVACIANQNNDLQLKKLAVDFLEENYAL